MASLSEEIILNKEQKCAVSFGQFNADNKFESKPLLIIAGAGTGKTNTLAYRTANLIINGVDPERIMIMTFSRRAAKELVERTKRLVSKQLKHTNNNSEKFNIPWMGTFHSIANRLLRQYGGSMGLDKNFTIIDRTDAADFIDVLRHELKFNKLTKRFPKKSTCLNIYSRCVNAQEKIKPILDKYFPWCSDWVEELTQLFKLYGKKKMEQMILDYDDLLLYWYHLVEINSIAKIIRSQFDHILVDEYQDTNLLQANVLIRMFPDGRGLTVVGDDAQSIYSFRSAEIENILNFPKQFDPPANVIALKENYRSTQPILDLANQILEESKLGFRNKLASYKPDQQWLDEHKPKLVSVEDDRTQSQYIIERVLSERERGTKLRDQAVLFRSGYHSDHLEVELIRRDIPFKKYGGLKFLDSAHVKDLLSIIRWVENPKNQLSAFRVLKLLPSIGPSMAMKAFQFLQINNFNFKSLNYFKVPSTIESYWNTLTYFFINSQSQEGQWPSQMELAKLFYLPLLEINYEDFFVRQGDIEQLVSIAHNFASREKFISELTLDPPISTGDLLEQPHKDDDFLILSTIHSAKGQEWQNVFVLNVADGNFPNEYACDNPKAIEEERRLLNVAITRAKQDLHLIQPLKYWVPEQPKYGDKHVYGAKSRFLTNSVVSCTHPIFYPPKPHQTAEPTVAYPQLTDISTKIENMW